MPNTFLPANLEVSSFQQIQPLYQKLLDRPLESVQDIETWLQDYSDLASAVSEYGSRCQIQHSCHTDDPEIEKQYLDFVQQILPKLKPLGFACQKKLIDCPHAAKLTGPRYTQMLKQWRTEVNLFRESNIPLQTEVTRKVTTYGKLCGQMLVTFQGKELTLQQLARYLEKTDRAIRQQAWTLASQRRLQDRQAIDDLFDDLFVLRQKIATNADLTNYRQYAWQAMERFDYTPEDCLVFSDAIEKVCVPIVEQLDQQRCQEMGLDRLKPWDLAVDSRGRPPLEPFDPERTQDLLQGVKTIFERISPSLARQFGELQPGRNLDLDSRKGKRPGGYQSSLEQVRQPFIFMNAAGSQQDVQTLLHEAGHAFHYMAACDEPLMFLRHAPLEFCEVASMSMELIGLDHMDVFYSQADAKRAKIHQLESILRFFPWMATIDRFQHALYAEEPGKAARAETRTLLWLQVYDCFSSKWVDWTDLPEARQARWHAQLHLFHHPFYYVEYGIAQLGALQVWHNYRQDPEKTLSQLHDAFALGASQPLPRLFEVAGINFDFSTNTLGPLIQAVKKEYDSLVATACQTS